VELRTKGARFAVAMTLTLSVALGPSPAEAQSRAVRLGLLGPDEEPRYSEIAGGLKQGLRDQGYGEESVRIVERRVPREDRASAQTAIRDLRAQQLAALFVIGSALARLARETDPEPPIVFITPGDPVAAGVVSSLARPGRNMTAMTFEYPELSGKRLELLHEIAPGVRRVLALYDPRDASPRQGMASARLAATALGITLVEHRVESAEAVASGLRAPDQAGAVLVFPGGATSGHYETIIEAANARRLPTILHARTRATREALLTYGASDVDVARDAARLLGKILKGASAGDLPVERPTKLTLVVNLRIARALGLSIPQSVLLRADEVIR
jgi:putative tryptophan/tyrosine transport system substrate-binding protein